MKEEKYETKTNGKGCFEPGRLVGFIHASSEDDAENRLIASGQISEKQRGHFKFVRLTE